MDNDTGRPKGVHEIAVRTLMYMISYFTYNHGLRYLKPYL